MRDSILLVALTLVGCAAAPPASQQSAETHAANVDAAQKADYRVFTGPDGSNIYCPSDAETGSHVIPGCMNEAEWSRKQRDEWSGRSTSVQDLSGRPSDSGFAGR